MDDDEATARLVSTWLSRAGWRVRRARDAAEAHELVHGVHVVLLDFGLPDEDGLGILRGWRREGIDVPVVAMTGATSESVVEEMLRAGCHDVIAKDQMTRDALMRALEATREPPPFPVQPPPPRGAAPDDEGILARRTGRALLVDDVNAIRRLYASQLRAAGWEVEEAGSAESGLRAALEGEYDILLLDYLLPDVDGIGLLHELRRRDVRTPAIILSAHGGERLAREAFDEGANEVVSKEGLTGAMLLAAIERALGPSADVRRVR